MGYQHPEHSAWHTRRADLEERLRAHNYQRDLDPGLDHPLHTDLEGDIHLIIENSSWV